MLSVERQLNGRAAGFTGADTNGLFKCADEYFSVTDFAGASGVGDGLKDLFENIVRDGQFDFGFRQKVDDVLSAPVQFRMATLSPESFDLRYRDALNADVCDGFPYVVKFEWLDNRSDHFHNLTPLLCEVELLKVELLQVERFADREDQCLIGISVATQIFIVKEQAYTKIEISYGRAVTCLEVFAAEVL